MAFFPRFCICCLAAFFFFGMTGIFDDLLKKKERDGPAVEDAWMR